MKSETIDPPPLTGQISTHCTVRRRLAAVAVALCVAGTVAGLAMTPVAAARPAGVTANGGQYSAQVRRTEYGIPHILAHDYGSLGYGYGYAFAQDNLCEMADQVLTLRGERSRYFGPDATSTDELSRRITNLASDTYYQGLQASGTVQRLLALPAPLGATPQVRQLVDGYVAGYNRYLRDTGVAHVPDPTCRGKSWVAPITALDIWNSLYNFEEQSGIDALKQDVAAATPPTGAASPTPSPKVPNPPKVSNSSNVSNPPTFPTASTSIGSNGWALGRDSTSAHDGMVLADPHLPWTGDVRLYQVQLTIPGVLNVSGASFYGSPLVQIGHTDGLAWTHTASHAQHASIYQLSLVPGDPTSYVVDGKAVAMTRQNVTVTARAADGSLSTVRRTLYHSRYGSVLATGWSSTTAYAIRDANADNLRSLNEWLAMDSAQNLAQLRTAQDTYQGMPWVYTLATDATGTTYFADSSVVPHVTDAQGKRCILQANPESPDILDGSTSACDWGRDSDAIEPGIFGPRQDPTLTRADYVANGNNSPLFVNPSTPLTGYPGVFDTRTQLELRPQLGLQMIAERRAGTDGLGAPGFTLPSLQATMLGNRTYSAELGRTDVVAMCRAHPALTASDGTTVDVRAACDVLDRWDSRENPDSHGAILWLSFFEDLLENFPTTWWQVPYDPSQPITTPHGIDGDDPDVQHAFADTVEALAAATIPLDATPGSTMKWDGIPLQGCSDEFGCFNVVTASDSSGSNAIDPSPDNSAEGSSFIMAVEMTPQGPSTRTILTYSESSNPRSPHYADQTALFSRKQWVTERFTEAEIRADPHLQTTALHS
ncbi:MAG TPA: penicillin acylase family protein [Rugosimonospora sp.]